MSRHEPGDIINSGNYYNFDKNSWEEPPYASQLNYSRDHLIYILSCIAKTLGPIVINHAPEHDGDDVAIMENQVLVTVPVKMYLVPFNVAMNILTTDKPNPLLGTDDQNDDWWKNPQEAIKHIAKSID